jgi:hypothetical protein
LFLLAAFSMNRLAALENPAFKITDIFGRSLNEHGLTLVDWEGYMANPAIQFFVSPPSTGKFPASATLGANGARLYFDLPCAVGGNGPAKTISFPSDSEKISVFLSIFPDRDSLDEDYTLTINLSGAAVETKIPIHVIDQDTKDANLFNVTLNFAQDKTGFFDDPAKRAIVQSAAQDWGYFIGDMKLDVVPAGAEQTFIWNTNGFISGKFVQNSAEYRGYLLYAYGIHGSEVRSGGEPSSSGFQQSNGSALPIRRSGGYEAETAGNYNSLGWFLTKNDDDWWTTGNLGNEPNDLYSIAHHEIGHALFFNPAHTRFGEFKNAGQIDVPEVVAYHGGPARIDRVDHFDGEIDNASLRGAFGYDYFGSVPRKRWLITKLDLLDAQAIGYTLRATSAFAPLMLGTNMLRAGVAGMPYSDGVKASGGIPFYYFEIAAGSLPPGLALDSFTGKISGTPASPGTYPFTLRVRDYATNSAGISVPISIKISSSFKLDSPRISNGTFLARLENTAGEHQVIEASGDFSNWTAIATNAAASDFFDFTDPQARLFDFRFYRAYLPP